jgi:hypothetical protein
VRIDPPSMRTNVFLPRRLLRYGCAFPATLLRLSLLAYDYAIPEGSMKKLKLENLKVESFAPTAASEMLRGTVAAHIDTTLHCPDSYNGSCIISGCIPCYSDDPC